MTCAGLLETPDTGLLLMDAAGLSLALEASTPMMDVVEDFELTLGVGPCIDAFSHRRPVAEPDIAHEAPSALVGVRRTRARRRRSRGVRVPAPG